jgi:hypothetical protein
MTLTGHPTAWTCAEKLFTLGSTASGEGLAMKRREFITIVSDAAVWLLSAAGAAESSLLIY